MENACGYRKPDKTVVLIKVKLDRTKLPLQLKSNMKLEPSVTNIRLDCTYQPSVFSSAIKILWANPVGSICIIIPWLLR